jgi:N-acetylmuramoyl-L-alanine amidase
MLWSCLIALFAQAKPAVAGELAVVHVRVDGKPMPSSCDGWYDGNEVFVPIEVVRALRGVVRVSRKEDSAEVKGGDGSVREVALTRLAGVLMISLHDVAGLLEFDCSVADKVCDLYVTLPKPTAAKGSVRPESAASQPAQRVAVQPSSIGNDKPVAKKPAPTGAAVVTEAKNRSGAKSAAAKSSQPAAPAKSTTAASPAPPPQSKQASNAKPADSGKPAVVPPPAPETKKGPAVPGAATADNAAVQKPDSLEAALAAKDGNPRAVQESTPERDLPSRGAVSQPAKPPAARIRDVVCEAVDPAQARLRIIADGVLKPQVSMMRNQPMLVVDMPGAVLETSAMAWRFSHPLVSEVRAIADAAPGLARLLVTLPRLVTYRVNAAPPDGYEIALRLPRLTGRRLEEMTIVIDPGHGGPSATGCSAVYEGTRIYEKNLTLKIGRKVYDQLRAMGMNVIMTRTDDSAINLASRPALANTNLADLFVSIHVDDFPGNPRASGTTAYYHGSDENGRALAHVLARTVSAAAGVPNRGARSDMERFKTGMAVLRSAEMPAVLLEIAYISNPEDRAKLMHEDCLSGVARAVAEGIRAYVEARMPGLEPAQLETQ